MSDSPNSILSRIFPGSRMQLELKCGIGFWHLAAGLPKWKTRFCQQAK